jgi:hypothetical protein
VTIEQWIADNDRVKERDTTVPPITVDTIHRAIRSIHIELNVNPVCIWVPSLTWLRNGLNMKDAVLRIWGIPVKELPPSIHRVLALHTTYDRIWIEFENGIWSEVVVHDH